jgi:hypothetical protein
MSLRAVAAAALAAATLVVVAEPAAATPVPRRQIQADVRLDCRGVVEVVTVHLDLPRQVVAGQAFAVSGSIEGDVGTLRLDLAGTDAPSLFLGSGTVQLVATGDARDWITFVPGGARRLDVIEPGFPPVLDAVDCVPLDTDRLARIRIGSPRRHRAQPVAPTAVDQSTYLECSYRGWFAIGPGRGRVSFTAPARLAPGQVFSLPDLRGGGGDTFALVQVAGATVDGSVPYVLPWSQLTVTAAAGEVVTIWLAATAQFIGGSPGAYCTAYGNGHLASIPVVAAPP